MSKYTKRVLGVSILTFLGFMTYCLVTGMGYLVAFIFVLNPWWHTVLGTLFGMVIVALYLLDKHKILDKG